MSSPSLHGRPHDDEQAGMIKATAEHWRKVGNEALLQAIARIEDAAKQLVALTSALQALYLAVFAFSSLRERVENEWVLLLFFLPVLLWLGSLFCAARVFVPRVRSGADVNDVSPSSWQRLRRTYEETGNKKLRWLHWSHRLLIGSFASLLLLLIPLVFLPDAPPAGPTRVIIVTPTPR